MEVSVSWRIRHFQSEVSYDWHVSSRIIGDEVWYKGKSYSKAELGDVFQKIAHQSTSITVYTELRDNMFTLASTDLTYGNVGNQMWLAYTFGVKNEDITEAYKAGRLKFDNFKVSRVEFNGLENIDSYLRALKREEERLAREEEKRLQDEERKRIEEEEKGLAEEEAERKAVEEAEQKEHDEAVARLNAASEAADRKYEAENKKRDEEAECRRREAEERARDDEIAAAARRAVEEEQRAREREREIERIRWELAGELSQGDRMFVSVGYYPRELDEGESGVTDRYYDPYKKQYVSCTYYPPEWAAELKLSSMFNLDLFDDDFIYLYAPVSMTLQMNGGNEQMSGETDFDSYTGGKVGASIGLFIELWIDMIGIGIGADMAFYVQSSDYTSSDSDIGLFGLDFNGGVSLLLPIPVIVTYGKTGDFWGFSIGGYLWSDDLDMDWY